MLAKRIIPCLDVRNGKVVKEGDTIEIIVNKLPEKSTVTINVNLKSFLDYTEPSPITNTVVENGVEVETTYTPVVENAKVEIVVGDDKIESASYKKNKTNISKTWTTSGVKEVKVIIDGVTRYTQRVDFNQGDQVIEVK